MAERENPPPGSSEHVATRPNGDGAPKDPWLIRDEQIRALVDAAPVAVIAVDPDGRIRMVNQKAEELFGYGRYELVGLPVETLLPESARERHAQGIAGYFAQPFVREMGLGADLTGRRKDGTVFPIEANLSFIEAAGNTVAVAFLTDTTKRTQAEEALRESEAGVADVTGLSAPGTDGTGPTPVSRLRLTPPHARAILAGRLALIGLAFAVLFWILDSLVDATFFTADTPWEQLHAPSPRELLVRLVGTLLLASLGVYAQWSLDRQKQATTALRATEWGLRTFAEAMAAAAVILQGDKVVYANSMAVNLSGHSQEELLGMSLRDLVHPDYVDHVEQRALARLRGEDGPPRYEAKFVIKGGEERWGDIKAGLIEFGGKPAVLATILDITERRQAEEALRLTQFGVDRVSVAAFWIEADARFVYANDTACRSLGYSREELLTMTVHDIDPDFPAEAWPDHWQDIKERGSFTMESRHRAKDGRIFPVEVCINYLEFGGKEYNFAFATDVTERKQAEDALHESERRFSQVFHAAAVGCSITRKSDGLILDANEHLLRIAGYSRDELVGHTPLELGLLANPAEYDAGLNAVQATGEIAEFEFKFRTKDGQLRDIVASLTQIEADGEPCVLAMNHDITDRKQAEEALRSSEERYRSLLEGLTDSVSVLDREWRYVVVNDAAESFLRIPKETLIGGRLGELFPGIEETAFYGTFERVMTTRQPEVASGEFPFAASRKRWFEVHVYPVPEGILIISCDITDRKRTEDALRTRSHDLGKRVKELNCLYGVCRIGERPGISVAEMLQGAADLIPPGWQYPEATCARITLHEQEHRTENFAQTAWGQAASIVVGGRLVGAVEVYYLQERPESDDGPFLKEERGLIDAIAERLGDITERKLIEQELHEAREELEARVERRMEAGATYQLTFRELTVLHLIADGKADKEIARELGIRPLTAQKHVANILAKMEASSRTEAGVRAVREGLLGDPAPSPPA